MGDAQNHDACGPLGVYVDDLKRRLLLEADCCLVRCRLRHCPFEDAASQSAYWRLTTSTSGRHLTFYTYTPPLLIDCSARGTVISEDSSEIVFLLAEDYVLDRASILETRKSVHRLVIRLFFILRRSVLDRKFPPSRTLSPMPH